MNANRIDFYGDISESYISECVRTSWQLSEDGDVCRFKSSEDVDDEAFTD